MRQTIRSSATEWWLTNRHYLLYRHVIIIIMISSSCVRSDQCAVAWSIRSNSWQPGSCAIFGTRLCSTWRPNAAHSILKSWLETCSWLIKCHSMGLPWRTIQFDSSLEIIYREALAWYVARMGAILIVKPQGKRKPGDNTKWIVRKWLVTCGLHLNGW